MDACPRDYGIVAIVKAYKYKLKVSHKVEAIFLHWLAICCELYNAGLQERRDAYRMAGESLSVTDQANQLPEIKACRKDVARVHSQVLQETLRRLQRAFENFFRRVKEGQKPGFPRFRSRERYDSFTFPQSGFQLKGNKLCLSKLGSCRVHLSRPIEGQIKTCTIKREADGWYVVFAVVENQSRYLPKTGDSVGVDVGLEHFATLSTGETIENPRWLRKAKRRLTTAQHQVSRRIKGSHRRKKAVRLLAKQHQTVARQRADFHHKEALTLIREFDEIAVEDLQVKNMVRNPFLAKSISDAGWSSFLLILTSKAAEADRLVVRVNPAFTSQDCSQCGERMRLSLAVREFRCLVCGFVAHRDHNAAITIKARAQELVNPGASRKRAPSGMVAVVPAPSCEPRTCRPTEPESPPRTANAV